MGADERARLVEGDADRIAAAFDNVEVVPEHSAHERQPAIAPREVLLAVQRDRSSTGIWASQSPVRIAPAPRG